MNFSLLQQIFPSLALMHPAQKHFAMESSPVDMGLGYPEVVTVIVARGPLADQLRQIGIKIYSEIHKNKTNPELN